MIPGSLMNPPTGVLPFDMFRSFAPVFDKSRAFTAQPPRCNVYETDKEIVLKLELREMKKEEVQVALEDNVLTLGGQT